MRRGLDVCLPLILTSCGKEGWKTEERDIVVEEGKFEDWRKNADEEIQSPRWTCSRTL